MQRTIPHPFIPFEYYWYIDAEYRAAAGERNKVTLVNTAGRVIALHDPNIPISTPPLSVPTPDPSEVVNGGNPVDATFNCVAPHGRGQGICVATPGQWCHDSGFYCDPTPTTPAFNRVNVLLNDSDDTLTLLGIGTPVHVTLGSGNDSVMARNLSKDVIDCGAGVDTAVADPKDVVVAGTCETVKRTP